MLKINDIKPIVEIPDHSIYLYYGLILLGLCFICLILYFVYIYIKTKKNSKQKEYFKILKNIEFSNQKNAAYTISKYGRLLVKEERETRLFEELHHELEQFKYRKNISQEIPNSIKVKYETFLDSLDV